MTLNLQMDIFLHHDKGSLIGLTDLNFPLDGEERN